jgi:hypothetical protein
MDFVEFRGWGGWVFVQFISAFLIVGLPLFAFLTPSWDTQQGKVVQRWLTDKQSSDIAICVPALLTSFTSWLMVRRRRTQRRVLDDPITGGKIYAAYEDSLWGIDLKYWPWLLLATGLIFMALIPFNIGPI